MTLLETYEKNGISPAVYAFGEKALADLKDRFDAIDQMAELNQGKVILAMREAKVDAACFAATTGYGYDDVGRERLEQVYAHIQKMLPQGAVAPHGLDPGRLPGTQGFQCHRYSSFA